MSQSYGVQHGPGGFRRASTRSDIGRVQRESGNEQRERIWRVAQRSTSPDDDGNSGCDGTDVDAINVKGGDVHYRAEEESQRRERSLHRGRRRLFDPRQRGPMAQERALWRGSTTRRLQALGGGLDHLQAAPSGQLCHLGGGVRRGRTTGESACRTFIGSPAKRLKSQRLLKTRNFSDHQLRAAMAAVDKGCPVQTAALDYDVPRSTVRSHVMGITLSRKRGRKPILSATEEEKGVQYLHGMAKYGHPMTLTELKIKVAEANQLHDTLFKDGILRLGWLH
jgi:hypothetical protein